MKRHLLSLLSISLCITSFAQWDWVEQDGSNTHDLTEELEYFDGGLFMTGEFMRTADFGPLTVTTNIARRDVFVLRMDTSGNYDWIQQFGTDANNDWVEDMVLDDQGNVYVCGAYWDSLTIGSTMLTGAVSANNGYVIKYDVNGTFQWAQSITASGAAYLSTVSYDPNLDRIYASGYLEGSLNYGSSSLNATNDREVLFVAMEASTGSPIWGEISQGSHVLSDGIAHESTCLPNGDFVVTGNWRIENMIFGTDTLLGNNSRHIFITSIDQNGNFLWATQNTRLTSGSADVEVADLISNGDDFLVTMAFRDTIVYNVDTLISRLEFGHSEDIFLAKMDGADGSTMWVKQSHGYAHELPAGLAVAPNGNIALTGNYGNYTESDGLEIQGMALPNMGSSYDIFVAEFDMAGNIIRLVSAGDDWESQGLACTYDDQNRLYNAGSAQQTLTFPPLNPTPNGGNDAYVGRLDPLCTTAGPMSQSVYACSGDLTLLDAGPGFDAYGWSTGDTTQTIMAGPGTYEVSVLSSGCQGMTSMIVNVSAPASFDLGNDTTLCQGNTLTLSAPSGYTGYSWNTGETNSSINVDAAGTYIAVVSDSLGCTSTDSINVVVDPCVGLEEIKEMDVQIYPNPTIDLMNIQVDRDAEYALIDLTGQLLRSGILRKGITTMDIQDLNPGVYLVQVRSESRNMTRKVVVH